MAIWQIVLIALGGLIVFGLVLVALFRWLYVRVPANMAFIRTGLGGRKVVADAGAFILPIVHNLQWLSLETFKIEIRRKDRDAFITKDRYRVDIGAEFYVKILPERTAIESASRSLGEKSFSAEGIQQLVEEKLVSAMRSSSAEMELVELHENRRQFALQVKQVLSEPLSHNGLGLEDVAIFSLDQTDKAQLDPNNIFDAQGLRQITAETSARMQERNEIERNTEVAVKRKDVEAVRQKLELDREQAFAEAEQRRQVESHRVEQDAEAARFSFAQELQTREAEIAKERQVREAELAREVYLVERERDRELVDIERERAIEAAKRAKAVSVLQEERKRLAEEEAHHRADALREEAEQAVTTVTQKAVAERAKEVALIQALHELEVADRRARATERLAEAKLKDGQAEASVAELLREAENRLDTKFVYRDVALKLIERLPEITREAMEPARHIDSIRVMDVNGLTGSGGADGGQDPIGRVYQALLGTGAALPIVRELLSFSGGSDVLDKLGETFPELKNVIDLRRSGGDG